MVSSHWFSNVKTLLNVKTYQLLYSGVMIYNPMYGVAILFLGHPYIESATALSNSNRHTVSYCLAMLYIFLEILHRMS